MSGVCISCGDYIPPDQPGPYCRDCAKQRRHVVAVPAAERERTRMLVKGLVEG